MTMPRTMPRGSSRGGAAGSSPRDRYCGNGGGSVEPSPNGHGCCTTARMPTASVAVSAGQAGGAAVGPYGWASPVAANPSAVAAAVCEQVTWSPYTTDTLKKALSFPGWLAVIHGYSVVGAIR